MGDRAGAMSWAVLAPTGAHCIGAGPGRTECAGATTTDKGTTCSQATMLSGFALDYLKNDCSALYTLMVEQKYFT